MTIFILIYKDAEVTSLPVMMESAYLRLMNAITRMIAVIEVTNQDAVRTFTISFISNMYDLIQHKVIPLIIHI